MNTYALGAPLPGEVVTHKSAYTIIEGLATYTGSVETAGLMVYIVVMVLILVFMRSATSRFFFIALPVTLIMAGLGFLKSEIMYLILIINVIGIVAQYRRMR